MCFLAFAVCLTFVSVTANGDTLYSDNFDTLSKPTFSIVYGKPEVVGLIGFFPTSSLALSCSHSLNPISSRKADKFYYDQIEYRIDKPDSPYHGLGRSSFKVSFDIFAHGLVGSSDQFAVIFDTPSVRNLIFSGDGDVYIASFRGTSPISKYSNDDKIHVDIAFDMKNDRWRVLIDGKELFTDVIRGELLTSIRFSHGAKTADVIDYTSTTYIDNILIGTESEGNDRTSKETISNIETK